MCCEYDCGEETYVNYGKEDADGNFYCFLCWERWEWVQAGGMVARYDPDLEEFAGAYDSARADDGSWCEPTEEWMPVGPNSGVPPWAKSAQLFRGCRHSSDY